MPKLHALNPGTALFGLPYEKGTFFEDVARWGRMIKGTLGPDLVNAKANASLDDFKALVASSDTIAVDIETAPSRPDMPWTGKDPTRAQLRTIAFGTVNSGVSCHWDSAGNHLRDYVATVLADERHRKIFHNGPWFDLRVLARYGLPVTNWEDSRDLRRALSSTSKLSLRYLGSLYCDISNWKDDEEDESKGIVFTDNLTRLQEYNAKDTIVTARVWDKLVRDVPEEERAILTSPRRTFSADALLSKPRIPALYELHTRLSDLCARMHTTGIWVNQEWRSFMHSSLLQSIEEKQLELRRVVGQDDFPCTDHGMRALIYKRHQRDGIKCFQLPDPWDPKLYTNEHLETISVDENSLIMLLVSGSCPPELEPIIDAWWALQGERKRLGYVKSNLFDEAIGWDGRLRPGWNSCGTDTGRFSCSEPNVMNIEQLLRHMLAPAPGKAIVHADKKQLEIRVMAAVAADMVLQDAINSGDLYTTEARAYFNIADDQPVKKPARQSAKIIRLARQYGAGLGACYGQALKMDRSFTISRTKLLMSQFDRRYYRTVAYWREETERVMQDGYSRSRLMDRRRAYPLPPQLSDIANYPIQSTAADIMNLEILELDEQLKAVPSARIIIQLHDAVDVECDEDDAPKVEAIIDRVMNRDWTVNGLTRPFHIDRKTTYASAGGTWADV